MNLCFKISGDDTLIENAITWFVTHHGWTDGDFASKLEYARQTMRRFVKESAIAHRSAEASKNAQDLINAAVESSFNSITTTIEEES